MGATNGDDGVTNEATDDEDDAARTAFNSPTDKELALLARLRTNPGASYQTLARELNVSRKTVSERIKRLREKGVIERVWANRSGSWIIVDR